MHPDPRPHEPANTPQGISRGSDSAGVDLPGITREIEDRLTPAGETLATHRARAARRAALVGGIQLLPRQAGVLAIAFLGATWVLDGPPLPAWSLPPLLLLAMLANAAALFRRDPRRLVDSTLAARAYDTFHHTKDRVSAALDLAGRESTAADGSRSAALARAAVDDGLAVIRERDARIECGAGPAAPRPSWLTLAFALAVAALPALLLRDLGPATPGADDQTALADARDTAEDDAGTAGQDTPAETPATDEPDSADANTRKPRDAEPEDREPNEPQERPRAADQQPRSNQGGGEGGAGAAAADTEPQNAPTSAEASSAAQGDARSGSSGGGGSQGASQSENPPDDQEREQQERKPKRNKPPSQRQSETKKGEPEQSAGAPSGPSSGGGNMTAVANERTGLDRGAERDDDAETEDEEVEDEEEESEQRGGVMPSTRDNMQPPARELSISGDGPPDDGRGGPTPPKKSRGTASLVLGVRLPDQVRGQPNPGTAKTTIEQVPPVPRDAAPRPASAAPAGPLSPNVQRAAPAGHHLSDTVRRYHELLKKTNDA